MRRARCPHLPGGAKLRSSRALPGRPDEDVWAYVAIANPVAPDEPRELQKDVCAYC
jgi:hypothetical protein